MGAGSRPYGPPSLVSLFFKVQQFSLIISISHDFYLLCFRSDNQIATHVVGSISVVVSCICLLYSPFLRSRAHLHIWLKAHCKCYRETWRQADANP